VIGGRDNDRVDVLLFLEHVAVVLILLQPRHLLLDESGQIGALVLIGPTLVGGELCLRRAERLEWRRRFSRGRTLRRWGVGPPGPLSELHVEQIEIAVADRDDVLTHHGLGVDRAHAADPDRGDVHQVTRRLISASKHMARDYGDSYCRGRNVCDEFTSGGHACSSSTPNSQLPTPK
jgi:hypothetical protein